MINKGRIIWLYGLPSSGKTTLADMLAKYITIDIGTKTVSRLDGDIVRKELTRDLGFSMEDRFDHIRRVAFVAGLLSKYGVTVVCSFITPLKAMRYYLEEKFGKELSLIEVKTHIRTCMERDPKRLYKQALVGTIKDFTGLTSPYEEGSDESFYINNGFGINVEEAFYNLLQILGWKNEV